MVKEVTEELLKRIDALAEKLGTTGEYLWGVLVGVIIVIISALASK